VPAAGAAAGAVEGCTQGTGVRCCCCCCCCCCVTSVTRGRGGVNLAWLVRLGCVVALEILCRQRPSPLDGREVDGIDALA
jgi:hypothetical protein